MKRQRLIFTLLITIYAYCIGFLTFLEYTPVKLTSPAYGALVAILMASSIIGLFYCSIKYQRDYPHAVRYVSYGFLASILYCLLVLGKHTCQ